MPQQDISSYYVVRKMWASSILMAVIVFIAALFYAHLYYGHYSLLTVSSAVAATCAIMIGFSFAMSGMAYYFNFLDRRVAYRKYMGLIGYFFALLYCFMLLFLNPERYFYGFFKNVRTADFILGLSAMAILTIMALISNSAAMTKLGVHRWRMLLRLGYLAMAFFVIRAVLLEYPIWFNWFLEKNSVPPPRLVVSLFAVGVIFLRGSITVSKMIHRYSVWPKSSPP